MLPTRWFVGVLVVTMVPTWNARACDTCKTGVPSRVYVGSALVPGEANGSFLRAGDFHFDLTVEYRKWGVVDPVVVAILGERGRHLHDFSREWFYHASLSYGATDDLELSLTVPFRDLRSVFSDGGRPALVGSHDADSSGLGDMELGARWRIVRGPYELYMLGDIGMPTGDTHNRDRLNRRFESEFQPGGGGWSATLGFGVARRWDRWSVHFEGMYRARFKGERDYEFGDSTQLRLGGSYTPSMPDGFPPVVLVGDVIAQFTEPDVDRGLIIGGHRAKLLYLVPGFAIQPVEGLTVSVTAPIPVYQDWAFHQEIDYSIRVSVGYSF